MAIAVYLRELTDSQKNGIHNHFSTMLEILKSNNNNMDSANSKTETKLKRGSWHFQPTHLDGIWISALYVSKYIYFNLRHIYHTKIFYKYPLYPAFISLISKWIIFPCHLVTLFFHSCFFCVSDQRLLSRHGGIPLDISDHSQQFVPRCQN